MAYVRTLRSFTRTWHILAGGPRTAMTQTQDKERKLPRHIHGWFLCDVVGVVHVIQLLWRSLFTLRVAWTFSGDDNLQENTKYWILCSTIDYFVSFPYSHLSTCSNKNYRLAILSSSPTNSHSDFIHVHLKPTPYVEFEASNVNNKFDRNSYEPSIHAAAYKVRLITVYSMLSSTQRSCCVCMKYENYDVAVAGK